MRGQNREHKPGNAHKRFNDPSSRAGDAMTKKHAKNSAPIEVAQWQLNGQEEIRIRLSEYSGRNVIDLRVWWRAANGEYRPGPRGVTFDVRHLSNLRKGFKKACSQARKAGLIGKK